MKLEELSRQVAEQRVFAIASTILDKSPTVFTEIVTTVSNALFESELNREKASKYHQQWRDADAELTKLKSDVERLRQLVPEILAISQYRSDMRLIDQIKALQAKARAMEETK